MTAATRSTQMVRAGVNRASGAARAPRGYRRIRLVAEVLALLLIAVLLVALPLLSRGTSSPALSETTKVTARSGDTLWSVARAYPVQGMTTAQTAEYLATLNGLESSRIPVGSSILVPTTSEGLDVACN